MNTNQEIAMAIVAAFFAVGVLTLIGAYLIIGIGWQEFDTIHGDTWTRARLSGLVLIWRALARKCPVCGRGRIFKSYFTMNSACPVCNSVFWKNEGEWIGPMVIDYTVAVGRRTVVMGGASVLQLFWDAPNHHPGGGRRRRRRWRGALVAQLLDAVPVHHRRNDRSGRTFSLTERCAN